MISLSGIPRGNAISLDGIGSGPISVEDESGGPIAVDVAPVVGGTFGRTQSGGAGALSTVSRLASLPTIEQSAANSEAEGMLWDSGWFGDLSDAATLASGLLGQHMAGEKVSIFGKRITPGGVITKGMKPGLARAGLALALDVATDPVVALSGGGGLLSRAGSTGLRAAGKIATGASRAMDIGWQAVQGVRVGAKAVTKLPKYDAFASRFISSGFGRWIESDLGFALTEETKAMRGLFYKMKNEEAIRMADWADDYHSVVRDISLDVGNDQAMRSGINAWIDAGWEYRELAAKGNISMESMRAGIEEARAGVTQKLGELGLNVEDVRQFADRLTAKMDELSASNFKLLVDAGLVDMATATRTWEAWQGAWVKRIFHGTKDHKFVRALTKRMSPEWLAESPEREAVWREAFSEVGDVDVPLEEIASRAKGFLHETAIEMESAAYGAERIPESRGGLRISAIKNPRDVTDPRLIAVLDVVKDSFFGAEVAIHESSRTNAFWGFSLDVLDALGVKAVKEDQGFLDIVNELAEARGGVRGVESPRIDRANYDPAASLAAKRVYKTKLVTDAHLDESGLGKGRLPQPSVDREAAKKTLRKQMSARLSRDLILQRAKRNAATPEAIARRLFGDMYDDAVKSYGADEVIRLATERIESGSAKVDVAELGEAAYKALPKAEKKALWDAAVDELTAAGEVPVKARLSMKQVDEFLDAEALESIPDPASMPFDTNRFVTQLYALPEDQRTLANIRDILGQMHDEPMLEAAAGRSVPTGKPLYNQEDVARVLGMIERDKVWTRLNAPPAPAHKFLQFIGWVSTIKTSEEGGLNRLPELINELYSRDAGRFRAARVRAAEKAVSYLHDYLGLDASESKAIVKAMKGTPASDAEGLDKLTGQLVDSLQRVVPSGADAVLNANAPTTAALSAASEFASGQRFAIQLNDALESRLGRGLGASERFAAMPDDPSWGLLADKVLPESVVKMLVSDRRRPKSRSIEAVMAAIAHPWKLAMVPLSPVMQGRNFINNIVMAHALGHVSPADHKIYTEALRELLANTYAQKNPRAEIPKAFKWLFKDSDTWGDAAQRHSAYWHKSALHVAQAQNPTVARELWDLREDEPSDIRNSLRVVDAMWGKHWASFMKAVKTSESVAVNMYGMSETLFKHAVYMHGMKKMGLSSVEAEKLAQSALLNYQEIPQAIMYMRRLGVIPFPTFPIKALKAMSDHLATSGSAKTSYYIRRLPDAIERAFGSQQDKEAESSVVPAWGQDRKYVRVGKDKRLSYSILTPWDSIAAFEPEQNSGILGPAMRIVGYSPYVDILSDVARGTTRFGRPVVRPEQGAIGQGLDLAKWAGKKMLPMATQLENVATGEASPFLALGIKVQDFKVTQKHREQEKAKRAAIRK